jgi:hypothetical protein
LREPVDTSNAAARRVRDNGYAIAKSVFGRCHIEVRAGDCDLGEWAFRSGDPATSEIRFRCSMRRCSPGPSVTMSRAHSIPIGMLEVRGEPPL